MQRLNTKTTSEENKYPVLNLEGPDTETPPEENEFPVLTLEVEPGDNSNTLILEPKPKAASITTPETPIFLSEMTPTTISSSEFHPLFASVVQAQQKEKQDALVSNLIEYIKGRASINVFKGVVTTGNIPNFTKTLEELDPANYWKLRVLLEQTTTGRTGIFSPKTFASNTPQTAPLIFIAIASPEPISKAGAAVLAGGITLFSQYQHQKTIQARAKQMLADLQTLPVPEEGRPATPPEPKKTSWFSFLYRSNNTTPSNNAAAEAATPPAVKKTQ